MPSKKLIVFCLFLLIACFISAFGQEKPKSGVVWANEQVAHYHYTNVSKEQADCLNTRLHIQQLINQTYDDELHGIVDLKKYDEIHSLVAKLPSSGGKVAHNVRRSTN